MYQFIETIQIKKGVICNLDYHNKRMNATRALFWESCKPLNLQHYIRYEGEEEHIKCRVIYHEAIKEITYTPYRMRPVHTLRILHQNSIEYTYKSINRENINALFDQRGICDDILIIKNGKITDTSIANVALLDETGWYTPEHPLLKGTKRTELLDKGILQPKDIRIEHLFDYSQITLFNAMIDFGEIKIDVTPQTIKLL